MKKAGLITTLFTILLLTVPFILSFDSVSAPKRHYLLPTSHLNLLDVNSRPRPVVTSGNFAVVKMDEDKLMKLSDKLHTASIKGGFMDLEISMESHGLTVEEALKNALETPTRIDEYNYRLKPENERHTWNVIENLDSSNYNSFITGMSAFPDRYARSENGVQALQWIKSSIISLSEKYRARSRIELTEIPSGWWYQQPSLVVRLKGQDSSLPAVVMGGHMDTPRGNRPGADDDASGSGVGYEVLRSILQTGTTLKRDLYFMFYAAEEVGLVGSQKVVEHFMANSIKVKAALNFDMVGYKSANDLPEIFFIMDNVNVDLTSFMKQLATKYLRLTSAEIGETKCNYGCSDHASWTKKGFASAYPFEASKGNYNPHIHTERDTLDYISISHAMKYLKLAAAAAIELGEVAQQ